VQRDIDILTEMARDRLAVVSVSLTTLDRALARKMEPRAATPERRLETIAALSSAGIPVNVMTAPMIPALNDMEMERLLEAAAERGAKGAGYTLLRVPLEIKGLIEDWLATHAPNKAKHVMSLLRDTHGGKPYDSEWGKRMRGTGPYAEMLRIRFERACHRLKLNERRGLWRLDTTQFRPPPKPGDQLSLL
jgi:DNA repair photolyase